MNRQDKYILIIDDNVDFLTITGKIFEKNGIASHVAETGAKALDLLSQNAGIYGAILLDINLPDITGPELLQRFRLSGLTDGIPIVAVSGDTGNFEHVGFDKVIQKPFQYSTLTDAVTELLRANGTAQLSDY